MTSYESYENQINHPKPANTLRDRIAEVIYQEDFAPVVDDPAALVLLSNLPHSEQVTYQRIAQAIIDEFGLTVEEDLLGEEYGVDHFITLDRVVGKWFPRHPEQAEPCNECG